MSGLRLMLSLRAKRKVEMPQLDVGLGKLREAEYKHTLSLMQVIDDRFNQAIALNNIGNAYARLGEFQQALEYLLNERELRLVM